MLVMMKLIVRPPACFLGLACVVLLVLAPAGCSTPKINWAERVGTYTYDQAVLDFGPPDHSATLTDKTVVAEWLTARGLSHGYGGVGSGYGPWGYGSGWQAYTVTPGLEYYLRLTFGPDGRLAAWKKVTK
jgi:hypothetical protein